jgi:nucleoside-diphosphate-sugar epimerase
MRILVTGGGGFIGGYLLGELKKRKITVLGTTTAPIANSDLIPAVLSDQNRLIEIIENFKPDSIVHLAAIALVTHNDAQQIYDVNVLGTENLLKAILVAKIKRPEVLLVSTAGVYGNQREKLLSEDMPYNPFNHYSYSKMIMEMLKRQYIDDIMIHVVRPFNIIGIGQAESFLIPKIVKHFANRAEVLKLGNINSVRDYVEVQRCAWILAELLSLNHSDPFTVNICSGYGWTGHDVLDSLTEISGYRPKIEISDNFVRKNEVWRLVGNPKHLHDLLGKDPDLPNLKEILSSMYLSMK